MAKQTGFVPTLAFNITTERDRGWGTGYEGSFHIICRPVVIGKRHADDSRKADDITGFSSSDTLGGLMLDGLQVRCQGSNGDDPRRLYAFDVVYRDVFSIEARDVKAMAKAFTTIERKLDALEKKYGHVTTFAQYVGRVADALGITGFVHLRNREEQQRWGEEWRRFDLKDGLYHIDRLEYEWKTERERQAREQQQAAEIA